MKLVLTVTQTQEKNLLNSMKSQSLYSYQSSRPSDLFPHLKDLLIVLMVVKIIDSSMNTHIRISVLEFRQRCGWVTHPHVLQKLPVHPNHDKHPYFIGLHAHV